MSVEIQFTVADYTESILNDKLNLIVLAWIEKSGTASEIEIINEIGLSKEKLNIVLLKLYNNQLIEISDNFYKVSVKGKQVLDVSKISEIIATDVLANFESNMKDIVAFRNSFLHYRDTYYSDYLHTQNSLKIWTRMLDSDVFESVESSFKVWSRLIIVLLDLSFHFDFQKSKSNIEGKLNSLLKSFISTTQKQKLANKEFDYDIVLFSNNLDKIDSIDYFKTLSFERKEFYEFLYFRNFLKNSDLETKFNKSFLKIKTNNMGKKTYQSFFQFKQFCTSEFQFNKNFSRELNRIQYSKSTNKELENIYSFSFLLKQALSESDLANRLQTSTEIINDILKDINKNIRRIQSNKTSANKSIAKSGA